MSFADLRTGPLTLVWRRQPFGASTAALIVPSAMLAAVAVLVLGSGFGSVGVLGQLFAGPSLPVISAVAGARAAPGRAPVPVLPGPAPLVPGSPAGGPIVP